MVKVDGEMVDTTGTIWKAKGFKNIGTANKGTKQCIWFCDKCDKHRCKECGILLSNTFEYPDPGDMYGAFSKKHPDYCIDCFNKLIK